NGQLTLTGFARSGSAIELFIASPDPSGFGQGQTYLTTLTEGSASDLDATTGTYGPGAINGISQGTDTTNKFKFVISIPSGVSIGTYSIVVTNTAVATTAVAPSGFAFVNPTNGSLQITASNDSITNQNFGLFHGSLVSGTVFKDSGAGGGTANDGVLNGGEQ